MSFLKRAASKGYLKPTNHCFLQGLPLRAAWKGHLKVSFNRRAFGSNLNPKNIILQY